MDVAANPIAHVVDSRLSGEGRDTYVHEHTDGIQLASASDNTFAAAAAPNDIEAATLSLSEPADSFPEGGLEAWSVVLGAFLVLFPSFGLMVSIGTLQEYWHAHQLAAYTTRDVGWIPSVFVYLALGLGIWVGPVFDRYGSRYLALVGSTLYVVMVFLLAECRTYWQFMLCLGAFGGPVGATLTTTGMAAVSHWFKLRRGLAAGAAMIGSSFGGVTIPIVLRATLPRYGYQWAVRILGFIFIGCFIIGNILLKSRLPPDLNTKKNSIVSLSIFGDMRFLLLTISVFGFEIVLFGTLGLMPTYATVNAAYPADTGCEIPRHQSADYIPCKVYLISVLNGISCFGRILSGLLSDYVGRFNTLLISVVFTLFCMLVMWLPLGATSLPALYVFAAAFGFGTGCWMALTPACIGQLCRAEEFGRYYGTLYFIASLATLVCIPIGGELFEAVGAQALVSFFIAILTLSLISFTMSRWACLDWRWKWKAKV